MILLTNKDVTKKRKRMQLEIVKNPEETGRRLKFNILKRVGFTDAQTEKHCKALAIGEICVNSKEYRDWLLSYPFDTLPKINKKPMTNQQVYDKQMTGEEDLQPGKDYKLSMEVTMYEENNSVVGYTTVKKIMVWINNKFFKNYTLGQIVGNFWHEGQHKYGFDHSSATDYDSVPYACGYKIRDMADAYVKGARYTDLYPENVEVITVPATPTETNPNPAPIKVPVVIPPKELVCSRPWYFLGLKQVCRYV